MKRIVRFAFGMASILLMLIGTIRVGAADNMKELGMGCIPLFIGLTMLIFGAEWETRRKP